MNYLPARASHGLKASIILKREKVAICILYHKTAIYVQKCNICFQFSLSNNKLINNIIIIINTTFGRLPLPAGDFYSPKPSLNLVPTYKYFKYKKFM